MTLIQNPASLPRPFKIFIAVMTMLSMLGGYQLYQLMYGMANSTVHSTDQLLVIEENLDEAVIALGRQIQEWKDMLLRADDARLFSKHRKAFLDSSVGVQEALLRTRTAMQNDGMDAGEIELLSLEHKALVSNYLHAQAKLDPHRMGSPHEVDMQVIGVDRNLQRHISAVKAEIEHAAALQLSGTMPQQGTRYMVVGLLGTCSLLIMAMLGFAFASFFRDHDTETAEKFSSI